MKRFDAETIESLLKQSGFTIIQTEPRPTVSKIKATHKYGELNVEYTDDELGLSLQNSSDLEILVNKRKVILALENNIAFENTILTKRDEQKLDSFNTRASFIEASKNLTNFIRELEYVFRYS